ncbi:MAG: hypothetical protein OXP66_02330 [Candidatus Tectomicrobia bacterium]|nr:hypothetical protein [Candidatus Tectomicrobia bacterium]
MLAGRNCTACGAPIEPDKRIHRDKENAALQGISVFLNRVDHDYGPMAAISGVHAIRSQLLEFEKQFLGEAVVLAD